ncbi:unnamed protein product [Meloidogyne enterolobii]|uniref:Uncharacterized protein n=1 Tax=Meloidogyne enterolobii TaxID=390850 RepID=A0ACB0Y7W7_MELEN
MYFLPSEVQLDIFKYLNFKQLLNFQQTNCYLKNFINEYEGELARKEFYKLDFWTWAIEKSIPMFLNANDAKRESVICVLEQVHYCKLEREPKREFYNIRLPDFPKTIEDMKIARYFFQQIFNYFFKSVNF